MRARQSLLHHQLCVVIHEAGARCCRCQGSKDSEARRRLGDLREEERGRKRCRRWWPRWRRRQGKGDGGVQEPGGRGGVLGSYRKTGRFMFQREKDLQPDNQSGLGFWIKIQTEPNPLSFKTSQTGRVGPVSSSVWLFRLLFHPYKIP